MVFLLQTLRSPIRGRDQVGWPNMGSRRRPRQGADALRGTETGRRARALSAP